MNKMLTAVLVLTLVIQQHQAWMLKFGDETESEDENKADDASTTVIKESFVWYITFPSFYHLVYHILENAVNTLM